MEDEKDLERELEDKRYNINSPQVAMIFKAYLEEF